ncbi:MAG: YhcH/YjgK/YiaL family protein [Euryarchaeota archaeon]|jgi:YhcH/YjgK/YiaL family protein|nr:YhcH/YjgK/YiaL family protein [Euryarchaeota archaeon]
MIFDEINHADLYTHLGTPLRDSFDFIRKRKFSFQNTHTYEIGTEGIYAIPQEYIPKKKGDRVIESHRKYIDIQVMMEGKEYLGYAHKDTLHFSGYDEEHDTERLTGLLTFLPFSKGYFVVLFPQDAHMPGVTVRSSSKTVQKVVIKVPVGLWK